MEEVQGSSPCSSTRTRLLQIPSGYTPDGLEEGVWSEGIDAGSDSGLRKIAERAGINWADAQDALADESWRQRAEANRQAMFELGLWGVPSFQFGDITTWGQDRLWVIEQALLAHSKPVTDDPLAPA